MKSKILLLCVLFCGLFLQAQEHKNPLEKEITTIYFIRHAEKDRSDAKERNPHLTKAGLKRAEHWAHFFKDVNLSAVYSTQYHRTIETATPTAAQKNVAVQFYTPNPLNPTPFIEKHKGSAILIVGHSNTTPAFVNAFLGINKYDSLSDSDNGSVFKVQLIGSLKLVDQYHVD